MVPQLGPCSNASSARAWRPRAARHSQSEAQPLGAPPPPRGAPSELPRKDVLVLCCCVGRGRLFSLPCVLLCSIQAATEQEGQLPRAMGALTRSDAARAENEEILMPRPPKPVAAEGGQQRTNMRVCPTSQMVQARVGDVAPVYVPCRYITVTLSLQFVPVYVPCPAGYHPMLRCLPPPCPGLRTVTLPLHYRYITVTPR